MDARYKYGHRPGRRRRTRVLIVIVISLLLVGGIGALIYFDLQNNDKTNSQQGTGRSVVQTLDESTNTVTVDHPYFAMELPSDWKEIRKSNTSAETSVTWQATKRKEDNRYIKIYIDNIPKAYAVNRMVPLTAHGTGFSVGDISNNCSTFTKGGTQKAGQAQFVPAETAKWQGIDFMCDLAQVTDNEIGTSSADGINTVAVTGTTQGKHSYFFVYTDHNIQPNNSILYGALRSFRAK